MQNAFLASSGCSLNIGFIYELGHSEPWIVAMRSSADYYITLDYAMRWSIEAMFNDFMTEDLDWRIHSFDIPKG